MANKSWLSAVATTIGERVRMKIGKDLLISLFLVTILMLPATVITPTTAVSSVQPSVPKTEGKQSSSQQIIPSKDSRSTDVLRQFQSYLPEEKIDPGIKVEINDGASDAKIIVFYDLALKKSVIASVPASVRIRTDFFGALPFLSMKAPADMSVIEAIAGISGVRGVYLDRKLYAQVMPEEHVAGSPRAQFESPYEGVPPFLLNQTTELIGARELWDLGYTGEGVVIAITDTGINKTHPDFYFPDTGKNKVIFEYVSVDNDFNGVPDVSPDDVNGHGTHVASIAAGTGRTGGADYFYDPTNGTYRTVWLNPGDEKGVAPDAYLMNIKISHVGWAYTSWMMEGYVQAVLHGADVISTSFGGHYDSPIYDFPWLYTVEWAVQNGVVVSISAGNEGPDFGTIASAGYSDSVICVGATTKLDRIAWWSSRGPSTALAVFGNSFYPYFDPYANASGSQKMKPDIVAPGYRISAANAFYTSPEGRMYVTFSGTSMAAPHVAGAAALLLEAFPGAKPAAVKAGLLKGAEDLGLDPNVQGFGRLDVKTAYDIMNEAESVSNTIESPRESIPAYPPEYEPYPYFEGLDILVEDTICNYENFLEFIEMLDSYGANIYYYSDVYGLPGFNLTNFDMLLMLEPFAQGAGWLSNSTINNYVKNWGGKLLFTGDWLPMIPRPDGTNPYAGYNYYTKTFGITWQDIVGGGYSTNMTDHAITTEVDTLYFGGPLGSLITGGSATTIAYDPVFPGVDVFTSGNGKLVVISDDDVLDDAYLDNPLYESDNLRLGLDIVAWFAGIETTIFDDQYTVNIHDIGMGLIYPLYVVNGTSATIKLSVANFGNYTESTIYAWLQIFNSTFTLTYNQTTSISPSGGLDPGDNATITFVVPAANITSGDAFSDVAWIRAKISLWANLTWGYGDDYPGNNGFTWDFGVYYWITYDYVWWFGYSLLPINLIAKNQRTGLNPILSLTEPGSFDSYTSPFVAAFPGDWKPLNVTFLTSGDMVNGTMRLEGNVTDIADFYFYNYTSEETESLGDNTNITLKDMGWWQPTNPYIWLWWLDSTYEYDWNNLVWYPAYIVPSMNTTGHAFGYLEVKIPEDATTGVVYTGSVGVYNGTTLISSMPMNIEVNEPLAKLLYDDLGHYWMLLWSLIYVYEYGELPDDWLYDYKFLWNAYYDLWVKASEWGLDIDSLTMTEYFMETDLEKTLQEELPWRYEQIITSTFEETYSPYDVILEFNNKLLDLNNDYDYGLVYYRELDSGLYGPSNVTYDLLDIYDLVLKAKGNTITLADQLAPEDWEFAPEDWPNPYNTLLNFLGADIELSDTAVFNWTVTKDHMEDFPHWITHDVENFTMAGWCWPGYAEDALDWGGYFLDMNETGTTAVLANIESPHPYPNNYVNEWNITVPDAESIRVHFARIDLEEDTGDRKGDWLKVYDNNHTLINSYTGYYGDQWTSWVPGNTTYIKMSTDQDIQSWGFKIDMYQYQSEEGVQILSMATEGDYTNYVWGPVMAIDEHLTGLSPTTDLPYVDSKVFVLGEANQFENLFLEYQDWLICDITSLTAGYNQTGMWTTETLLHNILTYMSDKAPPTTTITYSAPSYLSGVLYVNSSTVFTIIASEPLTDIATTYYKIDKEEWTTYTGAFNITARADGNYTINYYSVDVVDNTEHEKSLAIRIDNTPSSLAIKSVKITPSLTTSSITVSWSVSDSGSGVDHVEIRIDDEAYISVENETSYTFSDLKDGAHTVYMRAADNLGQVGAVDEEGAIVDEISSSIAVQSYWPYLIGGIVVLVIIIAAAAYTFARKKTIPTS